MKIRLAPKSSLGPVLCYYRIRKLGCSKASRLRVRRLVSGKEGLSNQNTLSLSIKFPQWAQNGNGSSSRGGYHGTQASPHLPEGSFFFFIFMSFSSRASQSSFLMYCAEKKKCLLPEVERKAGYVVSFQMVPNLPDGYYIDLVLGAHFSLYSTSPLLPQHFQEARTWPCNHVCTCVSSSQQLPSSSHQALLL